jgi:hypothetical protein
MITKRQRQWFHQNLLLSLMFISSPLMATDSMDIVLHPSQGEAITIGQLQLTQDQVGFLAKVELADERFSDQFLSMRPFKCLEGDSEWYCYLPYPYENPRTITPDDLTDLEYDLLFIRKTPTEYGINPWNGVYYKLRWEDEAIVGDLHEVDMDILAAPPDDGVLRPIGEADLTPGEPDQHWLPRVTIGTGVRNQ